MPAPLRLIWDDDAIEDLEHFSAWSARQAAAVVEAMERMAESGWSLGHPTDWPGILYFPVRPLGVFYRVVGAGALWVIE